MATSEREPATFEFDGTPNAWSGIPVVNGHKILTAEKITVEIGPQDMPKVTLRLIAPDALKLVLGADARVTVGDETREALISMGWTPPPEAPLDIAWVNAQRARLGLQPFKIAEPKP